MPEGNPKSALAPIRRPSYSAEARRCRSAPKRFFLLDRALRSRWRLCRLRSREEQPAAAKIDAGPCVNHPDEVGTIRHGAAVPTSQKSIACPKAGPNRGRHRYADPRAHGGPLHRSALSAFLFGPCNRAAVGGSAAYGCGIPLAGTARFSFGKTEKGPPPRPARWGEEEQGSGRCFRRRRKRSLADFATTQWVAHPPWKRPLREQNPPGG